MFSKRVCFMEPFRNSSLYGLSKLPLKYATRVMSVVVPAVHKHRWSALFLAFCKIIPLAKIQQRPPLQKCVQLRAIRCPLGLNSIGSISTRPSGPYQLAFQAKHSTLDTVSCLRHTKHSHLDKAYKAFKS